MSSADDEIWRDEAAGPLIRPYSVSAGRTRPTVDLNLVSLVIATGETPRGLDPEHLKVLRLCRTLTSVAEVSAYTRLPVAVAKVLLADLVDGGAVATHAPRPTSGAGDIDLLEKLIDGLQEV